MKRMLLALLGSCCAVPAIAADLPYPIKAPGFATLGGGWFVVMGLETGGRVTNHSFDFLGTGTGTVEVGGALAGALLGLEYKNSVIMFRAEVDGDYDFGKGGSSCMGMGVGCNISHGGVITERVDFGLPQAWLGGVTPFASVGLQQAQTFANVAGIGSAGQWTDAFLAGAGLDIPAGNIFSIGVRWDHVWPAQAIALGSVATVPVVANTGTSDVFKINAKWRLP